LAADWQHVRVPISSTDARPAVNPTGVQQLPSRRQLLPIRTAGMTAHHDPGQIAEPDVTGRRVTVTAVTPAPAPGGGPQGVAVRADGAQVAQLAGGQKTVTVLDLPRNHTVLSVHLPGPAGPSQLAYSAEGMVLYAANSHQNAPVSVIRLESGQVTARFRSAAGQAVSPRPRTSGSSTSPWRTFPG
jgi:hypothetical protein